MDISENIRKLILAGIGAVSVAAEKSQKTLDELAQKGEEAMGQGKVLNERLRHEVKEAVKERATAATEKPADKQSIFLALEKLTYEERREIQEKLIDLDGGDLKNDR